MADGIEAREMRSVRILTDLLLSWRRRALARGGMFFPEAEGSLANSLHKNGNLGPTFARNWILPMTWKILKSDFWAQSLQTKAQPGQHLDLGLWDSPQKTQLSPLGLLKYRNLEIIHSCCFKVLSLWWFVIAAKEKRKQRLEVHYLDMYLVTPSLEHRAGNLETNRSQITLLLNFKWK